LLQCFHFFPPDLLLLVSFAAKLLCPSQLHEF
jgi:hypothetical protein